MHHTTPATIEAIAEFIETYAHYSGCDLETAASDVAETMDRPAPPEVMELAIARAREIQAERNAR